MAGEIQLNSTTALTEDTGAITLNNVNSATNRTNLGLGSIATQASGSIDIDGGAIDGVTIGTNSAATDVRVDNLKLDGNTISSTNTDGNIVIDPNGAGNVLIGNFTLDADQTVGAGQDNMVLTYDYAQGTIGLEAAASSGTIASQDSDAVAITGGSITGTEFDLKSTGTSIYKSDGATAVISESSGTVTVNNATLGSSVVFPAGHVIQTKQFIFSKVASTTSGSMTQITDGSVNFKESITVKANSKILVRATLTIGSTGNQGFFVGLFRSTDGTSFSEITALHNDSSSPANKGTNSAISLFHQSQSGLRLEKATLEYLDTITSAGTYHYALYYRVGSAGRTVVNITPSVYSSGSTNSDYGSSSSVMTLMEISG